MISRFKNRFEWRKLALNRIDRAELSIKNAHKTIQLGKKPRKAIQEAERELNNAVKIIEKFDFKLLRAYSEIVETRIKKLER